MHTQSHTHTYKHTGIVDTLIPEFSINRDLRFIKFAVVLVGFGGMASLFTSVHDD